MCLPDFIELKQIEESSPIIGYRIWRNPLNSDELLSEYQSYLWSKNEGPREILAQNSGIYSYNNCHYYNYYYKNNNYNNYYYNYYNNYYSYYYNYYNNNYNNYYYNYYYISGIIHQWGKVAIHEIGYRSEFAKINTLFTIRESDARGPNEFIEWIKLFNKHIEEIAKKYECKTMNFQDFTESIK